MRPSHQTRATGWLLLTLLGSLLTGLCSAAAPAGSQLFPGSRSRHPGDLRPSPPIPSDSRLDEVGSLLRAVRPVEAQAWKTKLHGGHASRARQARLQLWIGEYELAQGEQPVAAAAHFRKVAGLAPPGDRIRGAALYDYAEARFYNGEYAVAAHLFRALLKHQQEPGYDRRRCALWARHASTCSQYHIAHLALGIPEDDRIQPLCGVEGLAAARKAAGLPADRNTMLAACRVTGEGSSLQDLVQAGKKLGLAAHVLTTDDAGLRALPKPLIIYVEKDHFITVMSANRTGVSFLCAGCGPWPGGAQRLNWKQWRAMEATYVLSAVRPGSEADRALRALPRASKRGQSVAAGGLRLASNASLQGLGASLRISRLVALLKGHVFADELSDCPVTCGSKLEALHCKPMVECPIVC